MASPFQRVAREGALGLAATLGAANVAQLAGAGLLATWNLWNVRWDEFVRLPAEAVQRLGMAGIAAASIPAFACGAAACFWVVRRRGDGARRLRRRFASAWALSTLLALAAWLALRHAAQELEPYPRGHLLRNALATLALGGLPVWWLAEGAWRTARPRRR